MQSEEFAKQFPRLTFYGLNEASAMELIRQLSEHPMQQPLSTQRDREEETQADSSLESRESPAA